jgi:hypothetical protein
LKLRLREASKTIRQKPSWTTQKRRLWWARANERLQNLAASLFCLDLRTALIRRREIQEGECV